MSKLRLLRSQISSVLKSRRLASVAVRLKQFSKPQFLSSGQASLLLSASPLLITAAPPTTSWSNLDIPSQTKNIVQQFSLADAVEVATGVAQNLYLSLNSYVERSLESEGGQTLLFITAVNTAVYLLWKVAPLSFMIKHFSTSLESVRKGRVWTCFTANFSHIRFFHLAANMYVLNQFGEDIAYILGSERFLVLYCTAGVASSLASLTFRRFTKSNVIAIGASGAVVATMWANACFFPERRMAIIGTEKTLSMQELVLLYAVFDAAGLLGSFGRIDFAAHLGGAAFGSIWFQLIRDKLRDDYAARNQLLFENPFRSLFNYSDDNGDKK